MDHFLILQFSYIGQFHTQKNNFLDINDNNPYTCKYQPEYLYNFRLVLNLICNYYIYFQNNIQNDNHICNLGIFAYFLTHRSSRSHTPHSIHPNIFLFCSNKNQFYLNLFLFLRESHSI